jgi:hypothetical protein
MAAPLDFRDAEIGPGWKSGFTRNYRAFRTASRTARLPTRSQPGSHMSPVRSPLFNTFLMAFSIRAACSGAVERIAQHHRRRQDHCDWIDDALARNVPTSLTVQPSGSLPSNRTSMFLLFSFCHKVWVASTAKRGGSGANQNAEAVFLQSLDIAREQIVLAWELRAATSLARLLRDQGRSADAMSHLQPVYDRFTEGYDTADLKAAKTLLYALQ